MNHPIEHKKKLKNKITYILNFLKLDKVIFACLILLTCINLLVQYSANDQQINKLLTDATYLILSFIILFIIANMNINYIKNSIIPFYIITIILLLSVLLFGIGSHGAKRWLNIGIRLQPSELSKLSILLILSYYFSNKPVIKIMQYLQAAVLILIPVALIIKQPDLGTAILVFISGFFIMFLAGFPWKIIIIGIVVFCCSTPLVWHFLHAYQQHRIITLFSPQSDPLGKGYHIIQAIIAIGSGGFFGKGYLQGTQTHLDFIPEKHTDFVITVIAEEFGFLGILIILSIYFILILRTLKLMNYVYDKFAKFFIGGFILAFSSYIIINMGMVAGILPVVGVPLPLISYGGTATIVLMAGFGVVLAIAKQYKYS